MDAPLLTLIIAHLVLDFDALSAELEELLGEQF